MKKGKRIVGAALALTMAFSATAAAFAVSAAEEEPAYTPTYNDRVTEEKTAELIAYADTAIEGLITPMLGDLVTTIDGALPGFAESIGEVESVDAFVAALDEQLPSILADVLEMEVAEGMPVIKLLSYLRSAMETTWDSIDALCDVFGVEHGDTPLKEIINTNVTAYGAGGATEEDKAAAAQNFADQLTPYISGLIKLLVPNTVDKVLTLLNTFAANEAEVVTLVDAILGNIVDTVDAVSMLIGLVAPDLGPVLEQVSATVSDIKAVLEANTIKSDDEEATVIGFNFDTLVNQLLTDNGINTFVAVVADGEESTAMLKLSSINELIASIADEGVDSSADVLMVAYNYLYDNLFGNESNKTALMNVLNLLPSLLPSLGLDQSIVDTINGILPSLPAMIDELTANGPLGLLDTVMVMLGILEDPNAVEPTDPTEPTTDAGDNTNPGTGDAMFAVVAGAGVLAAGAVLVLAKKRKAD